MAAQELSVEIVDYAGSVWSGTGTFVSAPTTEGTLGIYARHEPLLALLGDGVVRIEVPDGEDVRADVSGGFLSVDSDLITVVTDTATLQAAGK
jgi:F-type H+-transporting ATPase subunit epsilon